MVRAQMGAGEAGRSGASALLEGEAGRLAESQARLAEQERKTQITGLATWLMGFDMNKERYDIADKQMAQQAAINALEFKDLNYQDMMEYLSIPKSAWSKEGEIQFNLVREATMDQRNQDEADAEESAAYEGLTSYNALMSAAEDNQHVDWDAGLGLMFLNTSVNGIDVPSGFSPRMRPGPLGQYGPMASSDPEIFTHNGKDHYLYEDSTGRVIAVEISRTGHPLA
jgi:hypothetical protein